MAITNKRTHPRFDSLNLLSYSVYDAQDNMVGQGMGRTLNVSRSGILLETHVPIENKPMVALMIGLAENLIEIKGRAVYSRPGENAMFETGIEFLEPNETQLKIVLEFIAAFEAQNR